MYIYIYVNTHVHILILKCMYIDISYEMHVCYLWHMDEIICIYGMYDVYTYTCN